MQWVELMGKSPWDAPLEVAMVSGVGLAPLELSYTAQVCRSPLELTVGVWDVVSWSASEYYFALLYTDR